MRARRHTHGGHGGASPGGLKVLAEKVSVRDALQEATRIEPAQHGPVLDLPDDASVTEVSVAAFTASPPEAQNGSATAQSDPSLALASLYMPLSSEGTTAALCPSACLREPRRGQGILREPSSSQS